MSKIKRFKITLLRNKSNTYIFPYLDWQVQFEFIENIANTYLYYSDDEKYFCVLYKWSSDPRFMKFENKMFSNHLFVDHLDYEDYVLYRFRLSRAMQEAVDLFVKGGYKDFQPEHKNFIRDYLKRVKASNAKKIEGIMSKGFKICSEPPSIYFETFTNHLKVVEVRRASFDDIIEKNKKIEKKNPFLIYNEKKQ